jgi:Na+-transporting methylmalonyl-CoA/oxaloacetate decarboxylase gamma subunit
MMSEGLVLTGVGMATVLGFLGLLVLVMNGTAAYFKRRDARIAQEKKPQ